jgi:hypothetical protein
MHLVCLIGFKTKITTLLSWTVTFLSTRRGQLTITDQQAFARTRLEQLAELAAETGAQRELPGPRANRPVGQPARCSAFRHRPMSARSILVQERPP